MRQRSASSWQTSKRPSEDLSTSREASSCPRSAAPLVAIASHSRLFVQVTSNADLLRNPLGGSLLSLSPAKDRAGFSQSVVDVSASPTVGDSARPRSVLCWNLSTY